MADITEPGGSVLEDRLKDFLQKREPPKTFCPSEVARALSRDELETLGFAEWRDAMPSIRELAWHMRESGNCEILQKAQPVETESLEDIRGPIRIRRTG